MAWAGRRRGANSDDDLERGHRTSVGPSADTASRSYIRPASMIRSRNWLRLGRARAREHLWPAVLPPRSGPRAGTRREFAMSRAKPISWVAMTIVIPLPRARASTSSTSATSSGSRALVTSSSSRMSGCIASARTIATRCCWPPESRSGYSSALSASPKRSRSARRRSSASSSRQPQDLPRRQRDVVEDGHVGEEVEGLEHDPDPPPHAFTSTPRCVISIAVDHDRARRRSARGG